MQGFVTVGFRIAQPVTESFRRRIVLIGDHGIYFPAIFFFFFKRRVEDHPDREEIIDFFESDAFFAHLIPDGVNALGPAINIEVESASIQFVFQGLDKFVDITGPLAFGFGQFAGYFAIFFRLEVFHRQVFQLGFYGIQSHAMSQRSVDIDRLRSDLELFFSFHAVQRPHIVQAVGQFDQDDTRIVGQGE